MKFAISKWTTQASNVVQYLPVWDCKSLACQVGRTEELSLDLWFLPPRIGVQQSLCHKGLQRKVVTSPVSSGLGVDKSGLDLLWKIGEDCSPMEGMGLDPWFAARLKTSSGDIGSGGCGAVPGGSRSGALAMRAGWPVELCPPPEARMISTASSTLCRRLSSLANKSRSWAGVSSSSIPVILLARLGRRLYTLGNRRSPSCC